MVTKCQQLKNPYLTESEWGWAVDPLGLRISLIQMYERYNVPLFIVDNVLELLMNLTKMVKSLMITVSITLPNIFNV